MLPLSSLSASTYIANQSTVNELSSNISSLTYDNTYTIDLYKVLYNNLKEMHSEVTACSTLEELQNSYENLINTIYDGILADLIEYTPPSPPPAPSYPETPQITYFSNSYDGSEEYLVANNNFIVTGYSLFLDQSDSESGFYINTSTGQALKCEVISQNTSIETGECSYMLINPVGYSDTESYISYKQLTTNNSYYIARYPTTGFIEIKLDSEII
jgi:hypothetical protein